MLAPVAFVDAAEVFVLVEAVVGAAGAVDATLDVVIDVVPAAALVVPAAAAVVEAGLATGEAVEPEARYGGAALAVEGSTRAPVPQGMAEPSGSVAFVGSVVVPSEAAIVKRVVQVRLEGAAGEENW